MDHNTKEINTKGKKPEEIAKEIVKNVEEKEAAEDKKDGFFARIWTAIRDFFARVIEFVKNLF